MTCLRISLPLVVVVGFTWAQPGVAAGDETQRMNSIGCIAPDLAKVDIGFTLTHVALHQADAEACRTAPGATLSGSENVALHYDIPEFRERVRNHIGTMAKEGARAARTIIWYRHAEDRPMAVAASRNDVLGYLVATGGRIPDSNIYNLHALAEDLAAAGYVRFYLNIAPMGTSNARTSARECGVGTRACFDKQLLPRNWSVARQIIESFRKRPAGKLDLVFDLASESCFVASSEAEVERNLEETVRYIVRQYKATFGDGGFVVSCPASREPRALAGLRSLESLYREFNVTPAALDIHLYDTNPTEIERILEAGESASDRLGVPLDIAETYADNQFILSSISTMVTAGRLKRLRTLMMFPRTSESACQIDVPPPYDMSRFDAELGRRDISGRKKPVCG